VTCREFADFLLSYVDGDLAPAVQAGFDAHLEVCPDCVRYLQQYLDTIAAAPLAFADEDFAQVPEELVHAILASRRPNAG
jgi:anti-sigma factor RsiW